MAQTGIPFMILWPLLAKLEVLRQACLFTQRAVSGRKNLKNLDQLPSRFNVLLMEDIQCIFPFFCGTNTDQLLTRSLSLGNFLRDGGVLALGHLWVLGSNLHF
jgi:hypothetical protein